MIDVLSEFRKRRSHYHLVGEILDVAREGASKTRIMYRANLSASMTNGYITLLQQSDLIQVWNDNGRTRYKTNERGISYLQSYGRILQLLCSSHGNSIQPSIKGGPFTYWIEKAPSVGTT